MVRVAFALIDAKIARRDRVSRRVASPEDR